MSKPTLRRDLPEIAKDYDDRRSAPRERSWPRRDPGQRPCANPRPAVPYDVWAAAETVKLIREAWQFKPDIKGVFVVNRKIANAAIGRDVAPALAHFADIPVLPTAISQRVIFAESAGSGLSVIEAAPTSDAAREITMLTGSLIQNKEKKVA